ncbi:Small nuclear RNA activation protein (SNAP) 50 [Trypanosoma brucei equiperdum]|uniref:Small nuclear RNA activation protein (SNAP) 50 n=2 Tax=Trypanosoma brucei TaxID=5691 RepID=A0A3L6L0S2_9TRYP|nr:Small nuclear RNA activation protein (SNAP) 50 [Trypanosoma brucei equiperdum]CAE46454.1 small nuclear RNA gene activation protein 50 [Trypanosoma brucei brucei]
MPPKQLVDPFSLQVGNKEETTLADVAAHTAVTLTDIRRRNPQLDVYKISDKLPAGTIVHLPQTLSERGNPYGCFFTIGEAEDAMRKLEARLDRLLEEEGPNLPELPTRRVLSKMERIVTQVKEEGERQLARVREEYSECERRPALLQFLVDLEPVKRLREQLDEEYDGRKLRLKVMDEGNSELFRHAEPRYPNKGIAASLRHNVIDTSEDFCLTEHSHRWEFTFFTPGSTTEPQETWAVLSCQSLGTLLDTFVCRNCIPVNISKNAFFFIGGTFYVDNRHAGEGGEDYEDLTAPIRHFDPCGEGASTEGETRQKNIAFGNCPVKYVSQTTFGDLNLRLGEYGVMRHLGWCNHYFYLSSVTSLRGFDRDDHTRAAYPQRVMKTPTRVVRCRLCRSHPATVVCYNDEISPESPCPYCVPCFELLHATDEGEVEEGKFFAIRLPQGKYYTA